jgi:hypothetical protein
MKIISNQYSLNVYNETQMKSIRKIPQSLVNSLISQSRNKESRIRENSLTRVLFLKNQSMSY